MEEPLVHAVVTDRLGGIKICWGLAAKEQTQ